MSGSRTRREFLVEAGVGAVAVAALGCDRAGEPEARESAALAGDARSGAPRKPVVAVIGGGPAGLSAAFHLTNEPGWNDRYDVTVHQLGWRLGGKGATGRNLDEGYGGRIEEHGIHGFCRFYFNTWQVMKTVYEELPEEDLARLPAPTLEESFLPSSVTYSVEFRERWHAGTDYMPGSARDGRPWEDTEPDLGFFAVMKAVYRAIRDRGRRDVAGDAPLDPSDPAFAGARIEATVARLLREAVDRRRDDPQLDQDPARFEAMLNDWIGALEALDDERRTLAADAADAPGPRSRFLTTVDFYLALALGLARERRDALQNERPWEIDDLDGVDYRDWLEKHGASAVTLASPIAYSVANILFAYPEGDSTAPPRLSTASWLSWVVRSLLGRGEYFYFLRAGTGETVVLPLYLLLKRRGVRFEFFHKVVGVRSAGVPGSSERSLEELHFERQTELAKKGSEYDPLLELPERAYAVWPNQPVWEQIGDGLKTDSDYEDWGVTESKPEVAERGKEFDYVVWAIPPSMIRLVGDEGMRAAWKPVTDHLTTTATQAVQLWLTKDTKDLGWKRSHLKPEGTARYASASFPNPLNGCVAFDDVIGEESWPDEGPAPKGLLYLCSQLHDLPDAPTREEALARVRAATSASLRMMGSFLTEGRPETPRRVDEQQLDFDLLFDPDPEHNGEERLGFQYLRANTGPTEAYVQAPPGSLAGRLDAWDSGYANLVVAGDWIRTGFNLGSFESAVTGGKLAAFALAGTPSIERVVGYTFWHGRAGARIRAALQRGPRIPRS